MKYQFAKIHSICLVKNEVDIIEHCLQEASKWSDYIYVYDNGSSDGTWEKILSIQNDQIIAWKTEDKPFQESLRGEVFRHFRYLAKDGDWWCRLDADEFYIDSPREFLAQVTYSNHVIYGIPIEYYLTFEDIDKLQLEQPISELLPQIRYYKAENSEIRFFRYRQGLTWMLDAQWPNHIGLVEPKRILYKHYKYRTPKQIQKRLDTRRMARTQGFPGWEHAASEHWQTQIADMQELNYDTQNGDYALDVVRLPKHIENPSRRFIKKIMHGIGIWP